MLENIEKPYQCEHCRKWFSTIYVRNQHMTRCVLNYDGVEPAPIVPKKTTKFILDMANCLLKQLEIAKACQRLNVVLSHLASPDLVRDQVIPSSTKNPIYILPKTNLKCLLGTHCQGVVTLEVRH